MNAATVILFEPRDPLNIGSVVRACRNHDVTDLRVMRPRTLDPERVATTAPHSEAWIERHLTQRDTWGEAVDGLSLVIAFTARAREERTPRMRLSEAIDRIRALEQGARWGFVFGREDHGLPNDIVDRCDAFVTLETSAEYASLNLAQAVIVALHSAFVALGEPIPIVPTAREHPRAPAEQLERFMGQVELSLDAVGFFKGDQRDNVLRTVRRVMTRAELDTRELATLWGIFVEMERAAGVR